MADKTPPDVQAQFLADVRKVYPGRQVKVADGRLTVTVFPVGLRHMEAFARVASAAVLAATQAVSSGAVELPGMGAPPTAKAVIRSERLGLMLPHLFGAVAQNMLSIVAECCVPDVSDLPHWDVAPVVTEWIGLNFGEESRVRPWVRAIETMLEKTTGARVDLWSTVSKSWSPAAIQRITSSIASSLGGRTADGPSSSSTTGSTQPTGSSESGGQASSQTSPSGSPQGPTAEPPTKSSSV